MQRRPKSTLFPYTTLFRSLLILHRHQANGKPAQFVSSPIDHFFQLSGIVADRLLEQFAVVDVGTSSVPLEDFSIFANRKSPSPEPTIVSIFGFHPVLRFIVGARLDTPHPV